MSRRTALILYAIVASAISAWLTLMMALAALDDSEGYAQLRIASAGERFTGTAGRRRNTPAVR